MIDRMFLQSIITEKLELRYGSLLRKTGSFIDVGVDVEKEKCTVWFCDDLEEFHHYAYLEFRNVPIKEVTTNIASFDLMKYKKDDERTNFLTSNKKHGKNGR